MLINETRLQHWIDNFYGYGSWGARCWFVAYEEGGGDLPEEVAEKIDYFHSISESGQKPTLCDVREMYKQVAFRWEGPKAGLFKNFFEYRFSERAVPHTIWNNLIAFGHAFQGERQPDMLEYQKQEFVSPSAKSEALLRLYPLPAPHNHGWYYSWLDMPNLPFLKTRALYEEYVFPTRLRTILDRIAQHKPDLVLMYGMNNINILKTSFQKFFPDCRFTAAKTIKQKIPAHHHASINGTTVLITTQIPALRHHRVETGFDWEEFGARAARQGDARADAS